MGKRRHCKNNMAAVRSKNENVVLRMVYKKHIVVVVVCHGQVRRQVS